MSKERYEWYMGTSEIIDNKTKKFITQNCTELLNKQSKQIADLEAKLAEKEFEHSRDLDRLNEELKSYKYSVGQMWELLNDKDAEIEDMKDSQKEFCLRCGGLTHMEYDQDKTSFCIEKLVELGEHFRDITKETNGLMKSADLVIYINNQIEQLTHQHENKGE